MNWVLDHLQIIIVVAGAIAYWINQRAREKAGQEADYDEDGIPENRPAQRMETQTRELSPQNRSGTDIDQEERARRIREEIQRKIAERRGRAPGSAPAAPPPVPRLDPFRPVFQEEARPVPPPIRRADAAPTPPPVPARAPQVINPYDDSESLERQRRLAEQLEELEAQRAEARRVASQTRGEGATVVTVANSGGAVIGSRSIGAELRDPRALRRAFVLREVISAPVALR
jgi:hypothetical protein